MRQKQSIFSLFLLVALLAEGVDRNVVSHVKVYPTVSRPPRGGPG